MALGRADVQVSKAEEAEPPAATVDAQQDCMAEGLFRISPLRGYHHAIKQKI